jgi:hypothetical protein
MDLKRVFIAGRVTGDPEASADTRGPMRAEALLAMNHDGDFFGMAPK